MLSPKKPHDLDLGGIWNVTGTGPRPKQTLSFEGTVPGQIHGDLIRLGLIPDPFWRDNADACQWVEHWNWTYERTFQWTPPPDNGLPSWHVLEFQGLDTFAEVYLNGVHLGTADNMFLAYRFEVDGVLRSGENRLRVAFASPAEAIRERQEKDGGTYRACFSNERCHARKMQCGFGWDWLRRFVTVGVWRPVRLCRHDGARLLHPYVRTARLEEGRAQLEITWEAEVRCQGALRVDMTLTGPNGAVLATETVPLHEGAGGVEVAVAAPELWWPRGLGAQPLYSCAFTLKTPDGTELDSASTRFGIRTIVIDQSADPEPRIHQPGGQAVFGRHFVFVINGRPVFCRGANWVPADPFPARIAPEKYKHLLGLAAESNANMLRAWGGGIYEPDVFWDTCDELGVLVTQDFLMACSEYPEDRPDFQASLREEVAQTILRLRNHPSLAAWCGDNELAMIYPHDGRGAAGRKTAREISGPLCATLDPSRPFLATSPDGGAEPNDFHEGDAHLNCFMPCFQKDELDPRLAIDQLWARFVSEYAVCGVPAPHALSRFMDPEDIADPDGRMWEYHIGTNWAPPSTTFRRMERLAKRLCGYSSDPAAWSHRMAYSQYELVRRTAAALRRRKFACSGVLYWMFNDCWPTSAWGLVDAYGTPRSGWYAFKKAFQPVALCVEPRADALAIWVANDVLAPAEGGGTLRFLTLQGETASARTWAVRTDANAVSLVGTAAVNPAAPLAVIDYAGPGAADRVTHDMLDRETLTLPPARLSWEEERHGAAGSIRIRSEAYTRAVVLDAPLVFEDNYFDLLPGEERSIAWRDPWGTFDGPIPVACLNGLAPAEAGIVHRANDWKAYEEAES